ncbi:hypothetical protein QVD17_25524 [Tagetes erecta]|uniref:FAS1 domain-containing protein n=1 Tax=Tagetes erecta TaxID=13708 RepID=A0AAD8NVF9_TARER|nr:hypothetical protein QVD17_25524 [Tagetes erecta]
MHFKVYLLLYTHFLFIHYSNAFNITCILSKHPSFSTFNHYLSQTSLATEINARKAITVFVVHNNAISRLSKQSNDVLKNILKVHVVPDYYDVKKLRNLANQTGQMTTLFQTNGPQRFLKPTIFKNNIFIGSPTNRSGLGPILVRSIACRPCNLSVLYISTAIVPLKISDTDSDTTSPVEPPTNLQKVSPVQPPVYIPPPAPVLIKPPPPALHPSLAVPSKSPTDAPKYYGESPAKAKDKPDARSVPKPTGPLATSGSGCRDTFDFGIGVFALLIMLIIVI